MTKTAAQISYRNANTASARRMIAEYEIIAAERVLTKARAAVEFYSEIHGDTLDLSTNAGQQIAAAWNAAHDAVNAAEHDLKEARRPRR
jgi:hypothetical protein